MPGADATTPKSCTPTRSRDSVLVVPPSQLDADISAVRSGLRAAGVPSNLISGITRRATRSPRRQTGEFLSNREPRWKLNPNDPQYATEDDCKVIELRLIGMMSEFVSAPLIDEQTRTVLARYIGHHPMPGTYRDALTKESLDYNDFLDETLNSRRGRSKRASDPQ